MSCLTTLKLTSASSSAMRISRRASSMFSSVSLACPRSVLKARCSFSCRFSNIGVIRYFSSRDELLSCGPGSIGPRHELQMRLAGCEPTTYEYGMIDHDDRSRDWRAVVPDMGRDDCRLGTLLAHHNSTRGAEAANRARAPGCGGCTGAQ